MRVVKHWHRLPRAAVAAPSLAVFKARLDGPLSNLVWWKMSLLMVGGLEPDDLSGPSKPKPLYDSMILCFYDSMIPCLSIQGQKASGQRVGEELFLCKSTSISVGSKGAEGT